MILKNIKILKSFNNTKYVQGIMQLRCDIIDFNNKPATT